MHSHDETVVHEDKPERTLAFQSRRSAGRSLARALASCAVPGAIVLGIPRGGVIVADEVARALGLSLDVWLVRKIGVPFRPELGMGALSEGATLVLERGIVAWSATSEAELLRMVHVAARQMRARAERYRGCRTRRDIRGRTVILVDDGISTCCGMRAAIRGLRKCGASAVIAAAPVGASDAVADLRGEADDVVCLEMPAELHGLCGWYEDVHQVQDRDIVLVLADAPGN